MEKLLLFGSDDAEFQKINQIASRLRLHMERVDPADYALTLGEIASGSHKSASCAKSADSASPALSESLLVMCHLSDKRMDKLLFELRRADAKLSYKAVLTPTNAGWTLPRLMLEMQREKAAYAQKKL